MSNIFHIYLSGGMQKFGKENFDESNNWRKYCKDLLENYDCDYKIKVCNPNEFFDFCNNTQYTNPKEMMDFYLHKLRQSDLVIINFNDMWSLGSMSEIAIGYDRGIPIIGLNTDKIELHNWQRCMCERIFNDIDDMLDYIENFYLR